MIEIRARLRGQATITLAAVAFLESELRDSRAFVVIQVCNSDNGLRFAA